MAAPIPVVSAEAALESMTSIMSQIRETARPLIRQHASAQEVKRFVNERRQILRQLNGRALEWDNLDVGAVRRLIESLVETSDRFGDCGVGLGISLMKLRAATESLEEMEEMCKRAEVLMALVQELKYAYTGAMRFSDGVGRWDVEHVMGLLQESADQRRVTVKDLMDVMDTWTALGEWLDQLMVVREAVVSEREKMVDTKEGMELDAAKNPI